MNINGLHYIGLIKCIHKQIINRQHSFPWKATGGIQCTVWMVYQWCPNGYTKCVLLTTLVYTKQWGSEIRTSLDFKWSKRGWVANGPDFEWGLKSGSPAIWNPDKQPPFCQKSFEIWHSKIRISNVSGFWSVWFQIPTLMFRSNCIWISD